MNRHGKNHSRWASYSYPVYNQSLVSLVRYMPIRNTCSKYGTLLSLKYWSKSQGKFSNILALWAVSKEDGFSTFIREEPLVCQRELIPPLEKGGIESHHLNLRSHHLNQVMPLPQAIQKVLYPLQIRTEKILDVPNDMFHRVHPLLKPIKQIISSSYYLKFSRAS